MGLLKFLFWLFFFYYLFKICARLLLPILVKRFANKMQDRFNEQYQSQQKSYHEEGKVTIDKTNKTTKTKSESMGEYVDFEEVE